MLDKNTFGNSKASEILVEILSHYDRKVINKVASQLTDYSRKLNQLKKIDSRSALYFARLIYFDFYEQASRFESEICKFLRNVLNMRYKKFIKEMDGLTPYKERLDYPAKQ